MRLTSASVAAASSRRAGRTTVSNRRTWGTVSESPFFRQPQAEADQEVMGQQRHGHMVVPADPAPHLVMIHPELALAFFDRPLDRPAHPADADQRRPRH